MFAVVEFDNKSCAVVPYCWLFDNEKKCYWPRTKTEEHFKKLVENCTASSSTWPAFDIKKVIYTGENYEMANIQLNNKLNDVSSSSAVEGEPPEEIQVKKKIKLTKSIPDNSPTISSKRIKSFAAEIHSVELPALITSHVSADDSSDSCESPANDQVDPDAHVLQTSTQHGSASASTVSIFDGGSFLTSNSTVANQSDVLTKIFNCLENLKQTQDQQSIILSDVLHHSRIQSVTMMDRPTNMPNLPIDSKKEFRVLENFLNADEHFTYLKRRLAAVGGTCVRGATTNMLKFLLSNKVARKFNWGGRDKKPFKTTKLMAVIKEAILHLFRDSHPSDLSERTIICAVQDWLKLANQRYQYTKQKQNASQLM